MDSICKQISKCLVAVAIVMGVVHSYPALAVAPILHSQPAYQSPVRAEADDLLLIPGYGFAADDTVVYQAIADTTQQLSPPASIPTSSTATEGVAPIVSVANAPYSLTIRLPEVIQNDRSYAVWVRNSKGEWSNGVKINDARPLWLTPSYVYATAQVANLPRYLKVVGRNLQPAPGAVTQVRLAGPSNVTLTAANDVNPGTAIEHYVAKVDLPSSLPVGDYTVEVSRDGVSWVTLADQTLEVKQDPSTPTLVPIACAPDGSGNTDHTACIVSTINTATSAAVQNPAGATVVFGPGVWYLNSSTTSGVDATYGVIVPAGVSLKGSGAALTTIVEGADWNNADETSLSSPPISGPRSLFTLLGRNTVQGIRFEDRHIYSPGNHENSMFSLGKRYSLTDNAPITDVTFTQNIFDKPYYAITDGSQAIERLFVTYNEFGAYRDALHHAGWRNLAYYIPGNRYHIDHSIVAYNTFKPGSHFYDEFVTPPGSSGFWMGEGPIASQMGTSRWLDMSNNVVDGVSAQYLYQGLDSNLYDYAWDKKGWRAGFFWHMQNNQEMLLVSQNTASCTGDKVGDGEAIAFDNNQNTYALTEAKAVRSASPNTVTVDGPLNSQPNLSASNLSDYYKEHWIQIVEGPGLGQVRRIVSYVIDSSTSQVTFTVFPGWDVIPQATTRAAVGRQFWQVYTVDNFVDHRQWDSNGTRICQNTKTDNWASPGGPVVSGGVIGAWAQMADSTLEGNRQLATDGIRLTNQYGGWTLFQSSLEVRGNTIDQEYKWSSNCSWSGIGVLYSATPAFTVPTAGYGLSVARNTIIQADGLRGGAISLARSANGGPSPYNWKILNNTLIHHNVIRDIMLPAPTSDGCDISQITRMGINLWDYPIVTDPSQPEYYQYRSRVWRTVLYGNSCENVANPLNDSGLTSPPNFQATSTVRHCPSGAVSGSCECLDASHANVSLTAAANPATGPVGGTVTYTVRVTNNGPSSATAVMLAMEPGQSVNITGYSSSHGTCDSVSRSCALGTLANGDTATVTITGTATALGVSTSTFSVTQKEVDSSVADSGASVDVSVAEADLAVTVSDTPDPVLLGGTVTYTVTATNLGPSAASGVTATGTLPACELGTIPSGGTASCIRMATASTMETLNQIMTVSAAEHDPNSANNITAATTTVVAPDLGPTAFTAGKQGNKVNVSDTVQNQGNGSAGSFTVAYYLSTDTVYNPGTDIPLAGNSGGSGTCTRSVASLGAGLSSSISNKDCYKPTSAVTGTRYYVLVVDDATQQVIESNEGNNIQSSSEQVWW